MRQALLPLIPRRCAPAAPDVCSGASKQCKSAFINELKAPIDIRLFQGVQPLHCLGPRDVEARLLAAEAATRPLLGRRDIRTSSSLMISFLDYDPSKVSGLDTATDLFLYNQEWAGTQKIDGQEQEANGQLGANAKSAVIQGSKYRSLLLAGIVWSPIVAALLRLRCGENSSTAARPVCLRAQCSMS